METVDIVWNNPRLKERISELDAVRGLAILLVLVWHYGICTIPVGTGTCQAYALVPFRLTWSGVDLFFVLSGLIWIAAFYASIFPGS